MKLSDLKSDIKQLHVKCRNWKVSSFMEHLSKILKFLIFLHSKVLNFSYLINM